MKELSILLYLTFSTFCSGQIKAVIINSETKEKVPYVNIWVEHETIGTTSNENGKFELEVDSIKVIVFSAIGFETKRMLSESINESVKLTPKLTVLDEVVIGSRILSKDLIIGQFKKSKINNYFACGIMPWITARFFEFKDEYEKTPHLNKIRILTNSNVKNAKFNIRLYSVGQNGEPKDYLYDQNIIGIAKKGKKITEIDLSHLNFKFPKDGFFIAIEWFIIEENKYIYEYIKDGSRKKFKGISYEPAIGTVPDETDKNSWKYAEGKWQRIWKNNRSTTEWYKGKYNLLAIELTLTN